MPKLPVTAIIVSYNTREHLLACVGSLGDCDEVIVVDNASVDGSADAVATTFPSLKLIRNAQNLGFGTACNQGIRIARNGLILLLNSDATALPGAVGMLASLLSDPSVIAAGGNLGHASACRELTLWRVFCEQFLLEKMLPGSRIFNGYWLNRWLPSDNASSVDQVMGACLMMRSGFTFDEDYFLYCEDTELCYRLRQKGTILFEPRAKFTHALGQSTKQSRWWAVAMYNVGKERFFRQHHSVFQSWIAFLLNRLGALFRLLLWLPTSAVPNGRGQVALFWRVLTCPVRGPEVL